MFINIISTVNKFFTLKFLIRHTGIFVFFPLAHKNIIFYRKKEIKYQSF